MVSEDKIDLLTRIYESHYGLVVSVVAQHAVNEGDIEDVVQDVYVDFVSGTLEKKWDLSQNVRALLYRIAKRKSQLYWRKAAIRNRAVQRIVERLTADEIDEEETPEDLEARIVSLKHCLEKLPANGRSLVDEHYFQGLPMKEIAARRQMKPGAVRRFFHRVRLKLRECIEKTVHTIDSLR